MSTSSDCDNECMQLLKNRGVNFGKELTQRLKTGQVSDERIMNYEKEWARKLHCLDEAHTKQHTLHIEEAQKVLQKLETFAKSGTPPACPEHKIRVLSCLKENNNDVLACRDVVSEFTACVDDVLLKTSRRDYTSSRAKISYTEKFEQVSA